MGWRLSGGRARLAVWSLAGALVLYIAWAEARLENQQALANLAYDLQSCALIGHPKSEVEACFQSRGYNPGFYPPNSLVVAPSLVFSGWTLRSYQAIIDFDAAGDVEGSRLESSIGAF